MVYQAVAGSGKTQHIIDQLNETDRILILTFTNNNEQSIKNRIIQKYGRIPDNIHVYKILTFIYNFCLLPYFNWKPKGIIYDNELIRNNMMRQKFMYDKYIYYNQITRLIMEKKLPYLERLTLYFDTIYVDEFQDIASDELDWILSLNQFAGDVILLGDFFQKTYTTSNRGRKSISKLNTYDKFKETYEKAGFKFDEHSFLESKRCSPQVCNFISKKLGIGMEPGNENGHFVVEFITDEEKIYELYSNRKVAKLYFSKSSAYKGNSMNWGDSKGLTIFNDICVVLNKTTLEKYNSETLAQLAPTTLYKFYVACTRTTQNLYFISHANIPKEFKK